MSRMTKYYDSDEVVSSRYQKHEELYKEIGKNELDTFEVKSNATVIGDNKNEIDVEKIKKILDTKYNEIPKRQSIRLQQEKEEEKVSEITKEYDINVILEKAKESKPINYEEDRLRKLRDTQFDILKNLNVLDTEEKKLDEEEDSLKTLINTIAINEKNIQDNNKENTDNKKTDSLALDLLSDLKGDDNTEVIEGLKEKVETYKKEKTSHISDTQMVDSFYTTSNSIDAKDFEDIDDFSKSIESNNTFIKIIVSIIVLVVLIGVGILIKTIYFS